MLKSRGESERSPAAAGAAAVSSVGPSSLMSKTMGFMVVMGAVKAKERRNLS